MPLAVPCCCDELVLLVFAANLSDTIRNRREMAIFNNQLPNYPSCHPWISWSVGCRNPGTSSTESWMGSGSTSLTPKIAEPVLCSLCPDARGQEAQATSAKTWDVTELCFPNRGTQECVQTAKVSLVVATPTPAQRCPPANSGSGLQMRVRAAVTPRANRYGSPSSSTNAQNARWV